MINQGQVYNIQELNRAVVMAEVSYAVAKTRSEQDVAILALRSANNNINDYLKTLVKQ